MTANTGLVKIILLGILLAVSGSGFTQDELRDTFLKEANAAKAAAEAVNAKLFAPKGFQSGMKEYDDAEDLLKSCIRTIYTIRPVRRSQYSCRSNRLA